MAHGIAKNTFYQKLKLYWVHQLKQEGFNNRIAYSDIRALSNTQYDIQKWSIHA